MKNRELIEELYCSFLSKRKEALQRVIECEEQISQIDKFLESVKISEDIKFFSPHSTDEIFDAKVNSQKEQKESLESEIDENNALIEEFDNRIEQLKEILDEAEVEEISSDVNSSSNDREPSHEVISETSFGLPSEMEVKALAIQENERQRIANDLHDTTVQNLVHLIHSLELCSMFIDQDPVRAKLELESCSKNLKETIDGIRETIFNLRPMSFNDLGFKKGIDDFMNNMMIHNPLVRFEYDIDDLGNNHDLNIMVFRIIQECVTNSLKHSKSKDLILHVKRIDSTFDILVKDSGVGFNIDDVKSNHFGMVILEDRVNMINGKMDIKSDSSGTEVHIVIPL